MVASGMLASTLSRDTRAHHARSVMKNGLDISEEELKKVRLAVVDPATSPEYLKEVYDSFSTDHGLDAQYLLQQIALNPSTPDYIIKNMLCSKWYRIVLENPVVPLLLLEDPSFAKRVSIFAGLRSFLDKKLEQERLRANNNGWREV
jgi:hypothetical protein